MRVTPMQQAINAATGVGQAGARRRDSNRIKRAMAMRASNT